MAETGHHGSGSSIWRWICWLLLAVLLLAPALWRLSWPRQITSDPNAITIRYMAWGNPQQLAVEREIIRRFNETQKAAGKNLRVELTMPPAGGYVQKLQLMLASGTAPDVARVDHYNFPSLVPKGYFRDLTDLWQDDPTFDISDFHPSAMRENYYQGKLYALNVLFGGVVCYYNRDMFARAGLADPYELWRSGQWTWETFEDVAQRLTSRDASGRPVNYGFLMYGGQSGPPPWIWCLWVWRYGAEILSADGECLLDSPEAMRGMQSMHDLLYRLKVSPTPSDMAAAAFTFESGNVGMEFAWAGNIPRYRDTIRDFQWDIAPTPAPSDRPYSLNKGNQLVMRADCPYPKEAWEWMKYLTSVETELVLYGDALRRSVPSRKSVLSGQEYLRATRPPFHTDVLPAMLDNGKELPIDELWPIWTNTVQRFLAVFFMDPNGRANEIMPQMTAAANIDVQEEKERLARHAERKADDGR